MGLPPDGDPLIEPMDHVNCRCVPLSEKEEPRCDP